jgi:hypothetical protein
MFVLVPQVSVEIDEPIVGLFNRSVSVARIERGPKATRRNK